MGEDDKLGGYVPKYPAYLGNENIPFSFKIHNLACYS